MENAPPANRLADLVNSAHPGLGAVQARHRAAYWATHPDASFEEAGQAVFDAAWEEWAATPEGQEHAKAG